MDLHWFSYGKWKCMFVGFFSSYIGGCKHGKGGDLLIHA